MQPAAGRKAIVIGASAGMGRELAVVLAEQGYSLGLTARRLELLTELQGQLPGPAIVRHMDVADVEPAMAGLEALIAEMGGVDLIVVNAGVGHENHELAWAPEAATIAVNVTGFSAMCVVAMRHFMERGRGHLVGLSSIAAIRGAGDVPAYGATKAYELSYLVALRNKALKARLPITVTVIQPGFVDTAMIRGRKVFWCASARKAAEQIYDAIRRRRRQAYITRRWRLMAWVLKIMPDGLWAKIT